MNHIIPHFDPSNGHDDCRDAETTRPTAQHLNCAACHEPMRRRGAHPHHQHSHRRCIERAETTSWPPFWHSDGCDYCNVVVTPEAAHHHYEGCHDACITAERASIAESVAENHPFDAPGRPYRWNPADMRVLERDSPEGQAELARRAARKARESAPGFGGELAELLGRVAV